MSDPITILSEKLAIATDKLERIYGYAEGYARPATDAPSVPMSMADQAAGYLVCCETLAKIAGIAKPEGGRS